MVDPVVKDGMLRDLVDRAGYGYLEFRVKLLSQIDGILPFRAR